MATKCSHEDSRLTCIECGKPICSQCMTQCPVGFRCRACIGTPKSSTNSVGLPLVARMLGLFAVTGLAAGWIIPQINVPYVGCFICYFFGLFAGRFLTKYIDYRLGDKVGLTIVCGILIGMCFSPLGSIPAMTWMILQSSFLGGGDSFVSGLITIVSILFAPGGFFIGILRPTVWGEMR